MTLASGAHVKIGSYEFILDETVEAGAVFPTWHPHYKHSKTPLFGGQLQQSIQGMPTAQNIRPGRLMWSYDDWSGGENNRVYQDNDPTVYDFAYGMNPRNIGQLQGRPTRTYVGSSLTTADVTKRPILTVSQGAIWYAGSYRIGYSSDGGATWQVVDSTGVAGTDFTALQSVNPASAYAITAATGDDEYFYYSAWSSTTSGTRILCAKTLDNTNKAGVIVGAATSKAPFAGLVMMGGMLYGWTGSHLIQHDVSVLSGNTPSALGGSNVNTVYNTTSDPLSTNVFGSSWWANCVASENQVFMFYASAGRSMVYQYSLKGGGSPLWTGPLGFTIKSMKYQNGILFMSGHWGGDSNALGRGAMYAMPLDTLKPVFVGFFRKNSNKNLQMQEMANSYGSQILVAASHTGRIFVYDADKDSISMLDSIATTGGDSMTATDGLTFTANDHRIGEMLTFGTNRLAVIYEPGGAGSGNYQLIYYADDEQANIQASTSTGNSITTLESSTWDFDLPFHRKALLGFHVIFAPLTTGQSFQIEYSLDDAAYVSAGTLTSASADASNGRTFIQISDGTTTTKFTRIRWRLTLTGTRTAAVNYVPPIVYNVTTDAEVIAYEETWDLIIRLKDDQTRQKSGKRQQLAQTVRDWMITTVDNRAIVTFLDGYKYKFPGNYSTYSVTIDQVDDVITRKSEGSMKVTLRKVPD